VPRAQPRGMPNRQTDQAGWPGPSCCPTTSEQQETRIRERCHDLVALGRAGHAEGGWLSRIEPSDGGKVPLQDEQRPLAAALRSISWSTIRRGSRLPELSSGRDHDLRALVQITTEENCNDTDSVHAYECPTHRFHWTPPGAPDGCTPPRQGSVDRRHRRDETWRKQFAVDDR